MALINQMIRTKRLYEFISELVQIRNEELDDKAQWEFWLHKDYERSFQEFREAIEQRKAQENISDEEQIEIVKESNRITSSFVPPDE